jgi:hypothetical protein
MTYDFPLVLTNTDDNSLTILAIGTEATVRAYIHDQHRLGFAEANRWSRLQPVPNHPGNVMSLLDRRY